MSRYAAAFAGASAAERPLVFPYLTAGFPTPAESDALALAALRGGAAGLEIGVAFSDPLADGPTIQRANTAALAAGATVETALAAARAVRASGSQAPITLMGYLNPFLAYRAPADRAGAGDSPAAEVGLPLQPIAAAAAEAGVDGVILVDLPVEESDPARETLAAHGIDLVFLLAPTSTPQRIAAVAERAAGFIYLVSVTGVTGARDEVAADLREFVERVRQHTALPLAVGFGVRNRAQVEAIGRMCEAAVIGSALTSVIADAPPDGRTQAVERYLEVVTGRRRDESG